MSEIPKRLAEYSGEELGSLVDSCWRGALKAWGSPQIPYVKAVKSDEELLQLGTEGAALKDQLAFMKFPTFQTYLNLAKIERELGDLARGLRVVARHEVCHRHVPYDAVTAILLNHEICKAIPEQKGLAANIMNLYTDMCGNTQSVRLGDDDLPWAYRTLTTSKKLESSAWRVYARSMEIAWHADILPKELTLDAKEEAASQALADLFANQALISKRFWRASIGQYARIIAPFFDEDKKNGRGGNDSQSGGNGGLDATASENTLDPRNLSEQERDKVLGEIARELSAPGSDGLPTNGRAVKEYAELIAGLGLGDPVSASVSFYERLAMKYDVKFASRPFGRSRRSPFSVVPWTPSEPVTNLDVQHTVMTNGAVIPGVTTKQWRSRQTTVRGGEQEVIPTLDLYIDSSMSMPNPVEEVSLPVLAGFVAARRAIGQGVRSVNYSGRSVVQERTADLDAVYKNLVLYQNGGTVFPVREFLDGAADDPRLSLIITDTFLANEAEAIDAIRSFRARNKANRVTIYAITRVPNADTLRAAGAEVIHGTKPNIFKHIVGKTESAYLRV